MKTWIAVLVSCLALQAGACQCVSWVKVPFDPVKGELLHGPVEPADYFLFRRAEVIARGSVVESNLEVLRVKIVEVLKGDVQIGEVEFKQTPSNCAIYARKGSDFLVVAKRDLVIHQCNGGGTLGPEQDDWTRGNRQRLEAFRRHARQDG